MVFDFEFQRPSYYNPRLYSWYYPITKSNRSPSERPFNAARYYKPYWSHNPYYTSYSSRYPNIYRPYKSEYVYESPFTYSYNYIRPKLPSLSEILASKEVDRFKYFVRANAKSVELEENYKFNSYKVSKEKMVRESRASSVPRFVRETSLEPHRFLRSSLERDIF